MIHWGIFIFMSLLLLSIVAALLRHLNKERDERCQMMERYREMALAVRRTHLSQEHEEAMQGDIPFPFLETLQNRKSSVGEVEGES